MSDKILNVITVERLQTAIAFTGDAVVDIPATPLEFPLSGSRAFRIVVTSPAVVGTIVPVILESDSNADFTQATQVSLLQTYGKAGLIDEEAVKSATITTEKVVGGKTEYFIGCNPTKKYFGLRLTGTGGATATLDLDIIYMPAYLPAK